MKKRIIAICLFAWLPLLLLTLIDGKAWGGVKLPFLYDLETQVRFLVALPLLIGAELLVHLRLRKIVGQFIDRNIITDELLPRFRELIASAMKWRNSITIELILLILVFMGGYYLWNIVTVVEKVATSGGSWYVSSTKHSPAGFWYFFISRPLFQFLILRWYYRLFLWARFLWQSSRLKLNLIPTHPDHAGGLGFLAMTVSAFSLLIMAHGVVLAGLIANSIFFTGEKLTDFILLMVGFVLFLMFVILGPLLVFLPNLLRTKRTGIREYGVLASRYVSEFDHKWVHDGTAVHEPLVGSSDIQSLADMSNSFQIIQEFQPFPFNKDTVIKLIVLTLIPVLPLVLTMIPLKELIKKMFQVIF